MGSKELLGRRWAAPTAMFCSILPPSLHGSGPPHLPLVFPPDQKLSQHYQHNPFMAKLAILCLKIPNLIFDRLPYIAPASKSCDTGLLPAPGSKVTFNNASNLRLEHGEAKGAARPPVPPQSKPSWDAPARRLRPGPPSRGTHPAGCPSRRAAATAGGGSSGSPRRDRLETETARQRSGFAGKARGTAASAPRQDQRGAGPAAPLRARLGGWAAISWRGSRRGAAPSAPGGVLATILWWVLQPHREPGRGRRAAQDPLGVHWPLSCFIPPSAGSPRPHARAAVLPSPNSLSPLNVPSRHLPPGRARHLQGRKKAFFSAISFLLMLITLVGCHSGGPESPGLTEATSHGLQQMLLCREGKFHLSIGGFRAGGSVDKPLANTEILSRGSGGNRVGKEMESCPLHQGFFKTTIGHTTVSHLSHHLAPAVSWTRLIETQ